jgi:hypothetical protein
MLPPTSKASARPLPRPATTTAHDAANAPRPAVAAGRVDVDKERHEHQDDGQSAPAQSLMGLLGGGEHAPARFASAGPFPSFIARAP